MYLGKWSGSQVAVKELYRKRGGEEEDEYGLEQFKKEVHIMTYLNHPNLVRLFGITTLPKLRMVRFNDNWMILIFLLQFFRCQFLAAKELQQEYQYHPILEISR